MPSVLQNWVNELPLRQQGTLIMALRGPDGVAKEDFAKPIVRTLRGMSMNAGRTGEPMQRGVHWRDDPFMTLVPIENDQNWRLQTAWFFDQWDAYNIHFVQHLLHAYAICGMHYPVEDIRARAWAFYERCCRKLHMHPETAEQVEWRLRSGVREEESLPA